MVTLDRRQTLGLIGAAAASSLAAPAIAANRRITVGALRFTSHSASFIAVERGYFADAGLDVELKFFQAAQPMAVAIASGDAEVTDQGQFSAPSQCDAIDCPNNRLWKLPQIMK